jgi:site-specific recombinase XerC
VRIRFSERVTTAAEGRHLSQNTLTAYRRSWVKLIAWAAAEGLEQFSKEILKKIERWRFCRVAVTINRDRLRQGLG